jgi:SAM-dependent methyltransferase
LKEKPASYGIVLQAGPEEILGASRPADLNLEQLVDWPSVARLRVALPDLEESAEATRCLKDWGFDVMVGDPYTVALRLLSAIEDFPDSSYVVRMLATWKGGDLDYVDALVHSMQQQPCDFVTAPRDFDVTMAADVGSAAAIRRIGEMTSDSPEVSRARFNPFGYMETHPESFDVRWLEPAPAYGASQRTKLLESRRCHPENEFFGRDYAGSRYHFLMPYVPAGAKVLDIACGAGYGSSLMAKKGASVVACDYLEAYVAKARERFAESEGLKFVHGDGQSFVWNGGEHFDVVVSLHTLEHVPDDRAMIRNLAANLKPGGLLIMEVPLLSRRPIGVPINPYHLREYSIEETEDLLAHAGLDIVRRFGCCRGFTSALKSARDAVHIHAVKP